MKQLWEAFDGEKTIISLALLFLADYGQRRGWFGGEVAAYLQLVGGGGATVGVADKVRKILTRAKAPKKRRRAADGEG